MIPTEYHTLARIIHQERIQAAQARRPEWAYDEARWARPKHAFSGLGRLRRWLAQIILAARQPASSARPTETRLRTDSQ